MHTVNAAAEGSGAKEEVSTETLESTHDNQPWPFAVRAVSGDNGMWATCPRALELADRGQATKGAWWMPRHQEAMKDVVNCEMPRGAVSRRRSVDIRMGKPGGRNGPSPTAEYIGGRSQPGEVKHLSTRRKRNQPRLR